MIIYPAVDILGGRCVQLAQGAPETEVAYNEDPVSQAVTWARQGAEAIHVVNLNGALAYPDGGLPAGGEATRLNLQRVRGIRRAVDIPVQFAGGLRTEADLELAMELGVDRIVIGTAAVQRPELVRWALGRWGSERVLVAVEVRHGVVVSHGWQRLTGREPEEFGRAMYRLGVRTALYTDVEREGLRGGVDAAAAAALAEATGLSIVVSGGVGGLADIRALAAAGDTIAGVVVGQALYTGDLSLPAALAIVAGRAG